jgi:DNA-3-methyladenine glycosylase
MSSLSIEFYNRHVVDVAQDLLGKTLVFNEYRGIISETEAYRGFDDEASHAYKGITKRSALMFGPAGYIYVYMIYGIYYCLNIVTETEGNASAVLIRGLQIGDINLNGPGKICKYLGINKSHNGIYLLNNNYMSITQGIKANNIIATPRIGITKAKDKLWRFTML